MSDEDDRRRAREGEHDPAARAAAELSAARRAPAEEPPAGDPENPLRPTHGLVPIPSPSQTAGRPRKNPMWCRTTLRAGERQVDLVDQMNAALCHGLVRGGVPVGLTMFVYGMSVLPTVTSENANDVRRLWEYAEVNVELTPANLLRLPAKLVMPNPVLLPFCGAELDAVRLALVTDKALATKWLRQSIFGGMFYDLSVMGRPIQFDANAYLRAPLYANDAVEHDIDFLLVFYGIMVRGISS